ncbi:hypothetical protein [Cyanobium sp. Morenito 9A2]|uniref:hypothetical protein n=1 Tax=Cyanobium sp. Morenito 9A2 TaxID=2823718 RepID=UPI0020CDC493|nr:hypothetical protein [Cyanobium sp. Morenito 9A2]MCP9848788.1 hypothetical protein [Cyanobium sp. Morenito 9A2]
MSTVRRQSPDPLWAGFGLLALWILIELLSSSRWLEVSTIQQLLQRQQEDKTRNGSTPRLSDLLDAVPLERRTVWFAPYTTFPETGFVESRLRQGVYDAFKVFPDSGITSNYGAFKLSPADSLMAQASSLGLKAEAELGRRLGYRFFAIDLGAIEPSQALIQLCVRTAGCRVSSEGYALFPLHGSPDPWINQLHRFQRLIPGLAQISAAPRWDGLVFHPDQWWPPVPSSNQKKETFIIWARPRWQVMLYRYDRNQLPQAARSSWGQSNQAILLRLAKGLKGVDLCIQSKSSTAPAQTQGCIPIELRSSSPTKDIGPLLGQGTVTTIKIQWIYGPEGFPYPLRLLPLLPNDLQRTSPFAIEFPAVRLHSNLHHPSSP